MDLVYKIVIAVIAVILIGKYLQPILVGFFPPFGVIILIILYVALLGWLIGKW